MSINLRMIIFEEIRLAKCYKKQYYHDRIEYLYLYYNELIDNIFDIMNWYNEWIK